MSKNHNPSVQKNRIDNKKVLLALLPFWTPQIPAMGISCLKRFIQGYGYRVKLADANTKQEARRIYNTYFEQLRACISTAKRGNFYNIGHEVLQNHMMAHLNYRGKNEYMELVKILIYKTYYVDIDNPTIHRLNEVVSQLYDWLENYFLDLLAEEEPGVLGLSVYKGTLPASMFACRLAKEKAPQIKTVIGGAVFAQNLAVGTPDFNYFLEKTKPYIDKIIIGEGELLFLKLLQGELPDSQRVYTSGDIAGTCVDLSTVGIPDYSGLDIEYYPSLAAYTSRSCPFQCGFCTETVYWGKYRKKKVKQVVEELTTLYETYDFQLFLMCDSLLNPVVTDLADEFINSHISIYWDGYLRIDHHTCQFAETLKWRRGGFYRARLGVESGSQRILDLMGKKVTIEQIKQSISNLANSGVKTTTYWVIGYPGETEEDFRETLALVEELKDDIYEAECNPFGYYLSGQVKSHEWRKENKITSLYPEKARDMLVVRTWCLEVEPSRQETYQRINRFTQHCKKLGIANPYSLYDISKADNRWKKLHQNAVPPLLKFKNRNSYIDECKQVKKLDFAGCTLPGKMDFDF